MGTRSRIGIEQQDHSILSIYCHSDGYPDRPGVGYKLFRRYKGSGVIEMLLRLGDISALGNVVGRKHSFGLGAVLEEMTTAYGRDRGERGTEAIVSPNVVAFEKLARDTDAEWVYVYSTERRWMYKPLYSGKVLDFRELTATSSSSDWEF